MSRKDSGGQAQPKSRTQERFKSLYTRYYDSVLYYFKRRGLREEEARELTQDTFVSVYKGLEGFRDEADVSTWVYRIRGNIWKNWCRRQQTGKRDGYVVPLDDLPEVDPSALGRHLEGPSERAARRERQALVAEAIEGFPPQMRQCFLLRYYQDLSISEISEIMKLAPETVKHHLYRGRQRLRSELTQYFDDDLEPERE